MSQNMVMKGSHNSSSTVNDEALCSKCGGPIVGEWVPVDPSGESRIPLAPIRGSGKCVRCEFREVSTEHEVPTFESLDDAYKWVSQNGVAEKLSKWVSAHFDVDTYLWGEHDGNTNGGMSDNSKGEHYECACNSLYGYRWTTWFRKNEFCVLIGLESQEWKSAQALANGHVPPLKARTVQKVLLKLERYQLAERIEGGGWRRGPAGLETIVRGPSSRMAA